MVPVDSDASCFEVPDKVESSSTVVLKVELVDTCNRYVAAPVEAFQFNVGDVATFDCPVAGDASVGVAGT